MSMSIFCGVVRTIFRSRPVHWFLNSRLYALHRSGGNVPTCVLMMGENCLLESQAPKFRTGMDMFHHPLRYISLAKYPITLTLYGYPVVINSASCKVYIAGARAGAGGAAVGSGRAGGWAGKQASKRMVFWALAQTKQTN